jgi:hypothetical protein
VEIAFSYARLAYPLINFSKEIVNKKIPGVLCQHNWLIITGRVFAELLINL